ncbi:transmembrane protein 268 isoform X2 [Narcine bancroftii]|uniref:transmembrane protein 268 isoform X2 n=1 Tax=Narcine bancroftii TaxID=1343680 RepID=UPI00383186D3
MAHSNDRENILPTQSSLMLFEAVEEVDVIHWINDSDKLGHLSCSNSNNDPELNSASETPELYNGCTLLVLTSCGSWWSPGFNLESCEEGLARFGIQIPPDEYKLPIRASLMSPEVRRYMYFSSGGFMMLFAPINLNTDVRLIWANENLTKHNILIGTLDTTKYCASVLHLCFIYFNLWECERRLASLLEARRHSETELQSFLRQRLGHLCVVVETSQVSPPNGEAAMSEEAPLLPGNGNGALDDGNQHHDVKTLMSLVPDGTPEEMAYQLLLTYSGLYVKLFVTNQLPWTKASIHTEQPHSPCLCQYIETSVLNLSSCKS